MRLGDVDAPSRAGAPWLTQKSAAALACTSQRCRPWLLRNLRALLLLLRGRVLVLLQHLQQLITCSARRAAIRISGGMFAGCVLTAHCMRTGAVRRDAQDIGMVGPRSLYPPSISLMSLSIRITCCESGIRARLQLHPLHGRRARCCSGMAA